MTTSPEEKVAVPNKYRELESVMQRKLRQLWESREGSGTKATLALLRRSTTQLLEDSPQIWDVVLPDLPSGGGKIGDEPTRQERAAHLTLALYTSHQQSKSEWQHLQGQKLGTSLRLLAIHTSTTQGRLSALLSVNDFSELATPLLSLVNQMRSKSIQTDYAALAQDLLEFQDPARRSKVTLRWSRQFHAPIKASESKSELSTPNEKERS